MRIDKESIICDRRCLMKMGNTFLLGLMQSPCGERSASVVGVDHAVQRRVVVAFLARLHQFTATRNHYLLCRLSGFCTKFLKDLSFCSQNIEVQKVSEPLDISVLTSQSHLNLFDDAEPADDFPEYDVLVVEPVRLLCRDEKLRPVRARPRVGHREDPGLR